MSVDVYLSDLAADARMARDRNANGHLVVRHGYKIATVYERPGLDGWWFAAGDVRKKYKKGPPKFGGPFDSEDAAYDAALRDVRGF